METLSIEKKNAQNAFKKANKEVKALLVELFGEKTFSEKITDRVKTFEDAWELVEVSSNQDILLKYNGQDGDMIAAQAYLKLSIIAKALNEGWKPDWTNSSEYKYYPYFNMSSGFGLSCDGYDDPDSYSVIGSRLVFKTAELAKYAGTQFEAIYKDLFIIN